MGDKKGTIFGGLVEAPLQPSSSKKYQVLPLHSGKTVCYIFSLYLIFFKSILQGSNNCFVFTNLHDRPVIYRPTGNFSVYSFYGLQDNIKIW